MGLSTFMNTCQNESYCSTSMDRSLTQLLIESSNLPLKNSSRFTQTSDWTDGLESWTITPIIQMKIKDQSRRHLDFHVDLGLYLPRHDKPNSAPICLKNLQISSKISSNQLTPERIRLLLKREKDFLLQNDSNNPQSKSEINPLLLPPTTLSSSSSSSSSSLSSSTPSPPAVPTNTFRQSTQIVERKQYEDKSLSLENTQKSSTSTLPLTQQQSDNIRSSINSDTLKLLLKDHLTSILTRGASTTIHSHRVNSNPLISTEIKQKQSEIQSEKKLIDQSNSTNNKINHSTQPTTIIFHQKSSLGLTVTPLELSTTKQFQSISLEKMAQQKANYQDNDSISSQTTTSRPSTHPIPILPISTTTVLNGHSSSIPNHIHHQQYSLQKMSNRKKFDLTNSSSTGDLYEITNHQSCTKITDHYQTQNIRRIIPNNPHHSNARSSSKLPNHRSIPPPPTTTIELLPPIISGKRLHIPLGNHRYL